VFRPTRRGALAGLASGLAGLAGCAGVEAPRAGTGTPDGAAADADLAGRGVPATICEATAQADPGIYAVTDPAIGDGWAGLDVDDRYLFGDATPADPLPSTAAVIGLRADDGRPRARAYPLAVVWWHEAVNDRFDGPVLVTYCPLCRTGTVVDRVVDGTTTAFVVSGHLWQPPAIQQAGAVADGRAFGAAVDDPGAAARSSGNVVLVDRATGSFWSQVLSRAICGPRTGDRLPIRAATVTAWGAWRDANPGTDVLLPPPYSTVARP
jgi:hypothetical protein